jgi:hypothetical protein
MSNVDFKAVLDESFNEFRQLTTQREELDVKIAKLHQFIRATANMLPDEDRVVFMANVEQLAGDAVGLTDAIRNTLKATAPKWRTAVDVRDELLASGFDFSRYTSNPLASVHAVLKRMKSSDVESTTNEGDALYRWKEGRSSKLTAAFGQARPVKDIPPPKHREELLQPKKK